MSSHLDGGGKAPKFRVVGFDTETKPAFTAGDIQRTALVQVTDEHNDECLLAHVHAADAAARSVATGGAQRFPEQLARLLADPSVLVAGVGVRDDLRLLERDYGVKVARYVDVGLVAQFYKRPAGLQNLAVSFGLRGLKKPKSVQISDWQKVPLKETQVAYAAQDAALGLWVLQRLHQGHAPPGVSFLDFATTFANLSSVGRVGVVRLRAHVLVVPCSFRFFFFLAPLCRINITIKKALLACIYSYKLRYTRVVYTSDYTNYITVLVRDTR